MRDHSPDWQPGCVSFPSLPGQKQLAAPTPRNLRIPQAGQACARPPLPPHSGGRWPRRAGGTRPHSGHRIRAERIFRVHATRGRSRPVGDTGGPFQSCCSPQARPHDCDARDRRPSRPRGAGDPAGRWVKALVASVCVVLRRVCLVVMHICVIHAGVNKTFVCPIKTFILD